MKKKLAMTLMTVTMNLTLMAGSVGASHPEPMMKSDCKDGGFAEYIVGGGNTSQRFKNQGQCIQFVNTGK